MKQFIENFKREGFTTEIMDDVTNMVINHPNSNSELIQECLNFTSEVYGVNAMMKNTDKISFVGSFGAYDAKINREEFLKIYKAQCKRDFIKFLKKIGKLLK